MGYNIELIETEFRIEAERVGLALRAVQEAARDVLTEQQHVPWLDEVVVMQARTLGQVMEHCSWPIERDDQGNVVNIDFDGDKAGIEDWLFETLAPFVTAGSIIELQGSDGDRWRLAFTGTRVVTQQPTITYPPVPTE